MIDSTKKEVDKFGARVLKLAVINLGASRSVDGKKRVTNNTGALAKSLKYKIKQKRSGGKFTSGFDVQFYSDLDYAQFIEQGVKGSKSTKPSASKSPFKFKKKNLPKGVIAGWIKSKPIRLRDMKTGSFIKKTPSALKSAEFLIGRAIATKGISARHYFKDAVDRVITESGSVIAVAMALDHINNDLLPTLKSI